MDEKKRKYVVSPCGTSLLTNQADDDLRKLISRHANVKTKDAVPEAERATIEALIADIGEKISGASYEQAAKMSAELNGIIQLYGGGAFGKGDCHFLLSTDTWLGEETAKLVQQWLTIHAPGMTVEIHRQRDLQTEDLTSFQLALSELVALFENTLPGYSRSGYEIVFNLTGGFKGVQGFLQSIAHFFADETVYIFERSSELMRIPKLPVRLDAEGLVEKYLPFFRNLAMGLVVEVPDPELEIFLLTLDGKSTFSSWGELVWGHTKRSIYKKALLPSPRPEKIRYSKQFEKDVNALPPDRIALVNERIDDLNRHLDDGECNLASLDFKPLKGKAMAPATHEMDAWSDQDAKRLYGHFEGACFVLDRLDKGLH